MERAKQTDRRVIRTKAAIHDAYLRLLGQKSATAITMTDVASAASVDRKTVYNYYEGTDAILDELEDELVCIIGQTITEKDFIGCMKDPFGFLEAVTNAFSTHRELSDPLLRKNKRSKVLEKLGAAMSERVRKLLSERVAPAKQKYVSLYADFLTSGIVSVYRDWMAAGMQQPLEEIAAQIRLFLGNGISAFITT